MNENTETPNCECIEARIEVMVAMAEIGEPRAEAWLASGEADAARAFGCDC
jgi:hypothetical protein